VLAAAMSPARVKGELTLVVAGAPDDDPAEVAEADLAERVRELMATGEGRNDALRRVAAATGVPKRRVYDALAGAGRADRGKE